MENGRQEQRARFLVLQAMLEDKRAWAIFHAVFYKEGQFWVGKCLETESVVIYNETWDGVQHELASALFQDIQFAQEHKFLEEAYHQPTRYGMTKWKRIRKEEGLTANPPDLTKLTFKRLHSKKSKRTSDSPLPTHHARIPSNFVIPGSEKAYAYSN